MGQSIYVTVVRFGALMKGVLAVVVELSLILLPAVGTLSSSLVALYCFNMRLYA